VRLSLHRFPFPRGPRSPPIAPRASVVLAKRTVCGAYMCGCIGVAVCVCVRVRMQGTQMDQPLLFGAAGR
jgi:hypothetical protein